MCRSADGPSAPHPQRPNHTQIAQMPQMPLRPPWVRWSHTDSTDAHGCPRIANAPNSRAEALRSLWPLREIPAAPEPPRTPCPPRETSSAPSRRAIASACRSADGPSASNGQWPMAICSFAHSPRWPIHPEFSRNAAKNAKGAEPLAPKTPSTPRPLREIHASLAIGYWALATIAHWQHYPHTTPDDSTRRRHRRLPHERPKGYSCALLSNLPSPHFPPPAPLLHRRD